ncbi:MAG: hypothetical protein JWO92_18 [Chitinophagaceae bacterium]|nr:hypothetical protein [Chitinophagaceae bacterium]
MKFLKEDKIMFEKFFLLKEKRQFRKALKLLDFLESKYKGNNVIHGLYGLTFFELKEYKHSAIHYSKVIAIHPHSELASLSLFVSLIHLGEKRKALKELFRYTDSYKPQLYIDTIKELRKSENIVKFKADKKKLEILYKKYCL